MQLYAFVFVELYIVVEAIRVTYSSTVDNQASMHAPPFGTQWCGYEFESHSIFRGWLRPGQHLSYTHRRKVE